MLILTLVGTEHYYFNRMCGHDQPNTTQKLTGYFENGCYVSKNIEILK